MTVSSCIINPLLECIPQKSFLSLYLTAREIKESVRKISDRFSLDEKSSRAVYDVIKSHRELNRNKIAMEIIRQMDIRTGFIKLDACMHLCSSALPSIPDDFVIDVPISINSILPGGMCVYEFILLNVFISHPYLLWIIHSRIHKQKIINQSHYPYFYKIGMGPNCKNKFLPATFLEDILKRKEDIVCQLMDVFSSKDQYPFSGAKKNIHTLHQISSCYKIGIPYGTRPRLSDSFIKKILDITSKTQLVDESKRINEGIS